MLSNNKKENSICSLGGTWVKNSSSNGILYLIHLFIIKRVFEDGTDVSRQWQGADLRTITLQCLRLRGGSENDTHSSNSNKGLTVDDDDPSETIGELAFS